MKRFVRVGLATLAVGAALYSGAGHFAGPLPADLRIAQEENPGTPSGPDAPSGPYVQQHVDNQESSGPGSSS